MEKSGLVTKWGVERRGGGWGGGGCSVKILAAYWRPFFPRRTPKRP